MARRAGFTLVEILVVITIILILSAITVASLQTIFSDRTLGSGAQLVKGFLDGAAGAARARNRPMLVRFVPFTETIAGVDVSGAAKTTPAVRWRLELVDSDGDGDGVANENPGTDAFDFAPWAPFPALSESPSLDRPPPEGTIRPAGHAHAAGDPEDDKVVDTLELSEHLHPAPGTKWGAAANAVVVLYPNGTAAVCTPDGFMQIQDERTADFKADPKAHHDLRIVHVSGEAAYLNVDPGSAVVSVLR